MYNKDYLAHNSKLLSIDPTEQLIEIQERIKQQIQEIKDRCNTWQFDQALRAFSGQKSKKLFYSSQILHLKVKSLAEFQKYNDKNN